MSTYAISGYEQFHCLMGQCAHTCCAGWEIDIDGDRLEEYRRAGGALGDKLREKIDWASGCFRLEADERCPFLTEDGLCEIILTLGRTACVRYVPIIRGSGASCRAGWKLGWGCAARRRRGCCFPGKKRPG